MLDLIWEAIRAVWNFIKKIILKILNFLYHIVEWFRNPKRIVILEQNKDAIAVVIKQNLENGNFNVVNCLFDTKRGEIINPVEDAICYTSEELDYETKMHFRDKDMLVLK